VSHAHESRAYESRVANDMRKMARAGFLCGSARSDSALQGEDGSLLLHVRDGVIFLYFFRLGLGD